MGPKFGNERNERQRVVDYCKEDFQTLVETSVLIKLSSSQIHSFVCMCPTSMLFDSLTTLSFNNSHFSLHIGSKMSMKGIERSKQ
jgi:hypothetical protein